VQQQFLINKIWKKIHDTHEMNIINVIKSKSKVKENHVLSFLGVFSSNISTNDEGTSSSKK
jgi:hypothetical protein